MIDCSAPGKVYLFGEHAVVYGEPAIACAIDLRTHVSVEERSDDIIEITAKDLELKAPIARTTIDTREGIKLEGCLDSLNSFDYIRASCDKVFEISDQSKGVNIIIESDIPVAGGIGSSAATTVATVHALLKLFDIDATRREIADIGYSVEKEVQGSASPCDTFTSAMGGVTKVEPNVSLKRLDKALTDFSFVIGLTGKPSPTSKLVKEVKELKQKNPDVILPIIETIGKLSRRGETLIKEGRFEEIGELMNVNQGLLESLGVGSDKLSNLIYSARKTGALGAKITGAGGGGCMLSLVRSSDANTVSNAMEIIGTSKVSNVESEGVRLE